MLTATFTDFGRLDLKQTLKKDSSESNISEFFVL